MTQKRFEELRIHFEGEEDPKVLLLKLNDKNELVVKGGTLEKLVERLTYDGQVGSLLPIRKDVILKGKGAQTGVFIMSFCWPFLHIIRSRVPCCLLVNI